MRNVGPNLFECPECGLITCDSPKNEGIYNEKYLEHYRDLSQTELGKKIMALRWGFLRRHVNGHKTLLDYGTGPGAFLASYSSSNFPPLVIDGYDINPHSPFYKPINKKWDVVTAFDVIEHMESPRDWIESINPRLLVVLTPCIDALRLEPYRGGIQDWKHYKPGEHLHYFGAKSLSALFRKCGYTVEGWDYAESANRNPENPRDLITMAASR